MFLKKTITSMTRISARVATTCIVVGTLYANFISSNPHAQDHCHV